MLFMTFPAGVGPNCAHLGVEEVSGTIDDDAGVDRLGNGVANDLATLRHDGDVHVGAVGCVGFEFEEIIGGNLGEAVLRAFLPNVFPVLDPVTRDAHANVFLQVPHVSRNLNVKVFGVSICDVRYSTGFE